MSRAVTAPGLSRLRWMDGLRGVAAMQVVLLHYATAFLPGLGQLHKAGARYGWEAMMIGTPLFLPLDGYSAVSVFFLLSGVALTGSFRARPLAVVSGASRRVVRLGWPMLCCTLLGGSLLAAMPHAHADAARISGSLDWLGAISSTPATARLILHQIAFEGMATGYATLSLLPAGLLDHIRLYPLTASVDPPLWTLHTEFYGSLLVLLLVALRAMGGRIVHAIVAAALLVLFADHPIVLFVIGSLAVDVVARPPQGRIAQSVGLLALAAGVILCTAKAEDQGLLIHWVPPAPPLGAASISFHFQSTIGAVLLFTGLLLLPRMRGLLEGRAAQWLGRMSFSIYLVHFPVMMTLGCLAFVAIAPHLPYMVAAIVATAFGLLVTCPLAMAFERWVDRPAVRLSRRLGAWTSRPAPAVAQAL